MLLKKWDKLPPEMKTDEVLVYYKILKRKSASLFFKRVFDIFVSALMLIVASPMFVVLSIVIKTDSKGPVFFRQTRVTQYGKTFRIFKFRTMVKDAEKLGAAITVHGDMRVTRVGKFLRKFRLDEIPQLIDIFRGTMSFVGIRPEVPKYVGRYTPEMMATLLLPAGVTSDTSIFFKDEEQLLSSVEDADKTYVEVLLPQKMLYNLTYLKQYGFWRDIKLMFMTVFAVLGKKYPDKLAETQPEKPCE